MEVSCDLGERDADGLPALPSVSAVTTARPLFTGNVFVRDGTA